MNNEELKNNEEVIEEKVENTTEEVKTENSNDTSSDEGTKKPSKAKPDTATPIADEFLPENFNPFARPVNPRFANRREQEFEEKIIQIKRVIKVTKGGRRFKFSALVVVGDKKGRVGYAIGKHIEVPEAIKKAVRQAKKNLVNVKIAEGADTVPHEVIGHAGAARLMLKPAVEGKGVIASDVVRAVVELAGYRNVYSKNLGTNNPLNVVIAAVNALKQMKTKEEIFRLKEEAPKRVAKTPRREDQPKKVETTKQETKKEVKGE